MSSDTRLTTENRIVNLLSHWLAGHVRNDELRRRLDEIGTEGLSPGEVELVEELHAEIAQAGPGERGSLERLVRESVEALALGL
ncbi:MAG: hypothetical protein H0V84_11335 [Actinobacteria bacterium]|nr:hypothetical protein [Actinomycetota bacterium]